MVCSIGSVPPGSRCVAETGNRTSAAFPPHRSSFESNLHKPEYFNFTVSDQVVTNTEVCTNMDASSQQESCERYSKEIV